MLQWLWFDNTNLEFRTSALTILFALCIFYWISWIIYSTTFHPLAKIPGPFLASISRLWIIQNVRRGDMEHIQRRLHEKYGPIIRIAPNEVACSQPEAIKKIYPIQSPLEKTNYYPVWGNKAFSKYPDLFTCTNEKLHSERRKIVSNIYNLTNIIQYEENIGKCTQLFIQRLREYSNSGNTVDLGEWLQMYAFDVIGELFFGQMFGFMEHKTDYESYIHSLDLLVPVLCMTAVAPSYIRPFILGSSILFPSIWHALKAIKHIELATRGCVSKRTKEISSGKVVRRDLLQQLFELSKEKGDKVDFGIGEIQTEVYVALFAGSDTTAIAMRSVLYHLMKNPLIYQELQNELDKAIRIGELSIPIKYSEATRIPLLNACIKEGMRIHPSIGLTMPRLSPKGGMILCDHCIPQGYWVGINAAVVHYDKTVFGEDANQFRPSRWLQEDTSLMDRSMLNFGAGSRTCIGRHISFLEIYKLIPSILLEFNLELVDNKDWTTQNSGFNKQSGIIVRLKTRDSLH